MKTSIIGFFEKRELASQTIDKLESGRIEGDNSTYSIEEVKRSTKTDYVVKAEINYSPELQKELDSIFNN